MLTDSELAQSISYDETEVRSVKSLVSSLLKSFDCPICLDLLDDPVCTSCQHVFCRKCIKTCLQKKFKVPCPLCVTLITKRSLRVKPKFREILHAVKEVAESFKDDCGLEVSPPKPFLVSSSPEARSSMLAFQLTHPSPHKNPPNVVASTSLPNRKPKKRTNVHMDEDAGSLTRKYHRNSTNTNIQPGFPVTRKTRKPSTDSSSSKTIENYFNQCSSTTAQNTHKEPLSEVTKSIENVELKEVTNQQLYNLNTSTKHVSSDIICKRSSQVCEPKEEDNKDNITENCDQDNSSKDSLKVSEVCSKYEENCMKSVDDLSFDVKDNTTSSYDALDVIVNCKSEQPASVKLTDFDDTSNISTTGRRIFRSKNNENSVPVKNEITITNDKFLDPYQFIASQRTPRRLKKRGRKPKKSKNPVVRNSVITNFLMEKSSRKSTTDEPLKEIKSNWSYRKVNPQPDSLDDFQDDRKTKIVINASKTGNCDDNDDLFLFLTPAENVRAYCYAFGENIEEYPEPEKQEKPLKRKNTPRSSSTKKKKAELSEKDEEYLRKMTKEIAEAEAHELTIVGHNENTIAKKNSTEERSKNSPGPQNSLTDVSKKGAQTGKVLVPASAQVQVVDNSDSSDTEPLPYLHREDIQLSSSNIPKCFSNLDQKLNENTSGNVSKANTAITVSTKHLNQTSKLQNKNEAEKEGVTENNKGKLNVNYKQNMHNISIVQDSVENVSNDILVKENNSLNHEDEDLEPTQLLSTPDFQKTFGKLLSIDLPDVTGGMIREKDFKHSSNDSLADSKCLLKKLDFEVNTCKVGNPESSQTETGNLLTENVKTERVGNCADEESTVLPKVETSNVTEDKCVEKISEKNIGTMQTNNEDVAANRHFSENSSEHSKRDKLTESMSQENAKMSCIGCNDVPNDIGVSVTELCSTSQRKLKETSQIAETVGCSKSQDQDVDMLVQATQPFVKHTHGFSENKVQSKNNFVEDILLIQNEVTEVPTVATQDNMIQEASNEKPYSASVTQYEEQMDKIISISLNDQPSQNTNVKLTFKVSINHLKAHVMGSLSNLGCPNCDSNLNISLNDVQVELTREIGSSKQIGELVLNFPKTNVSVEKTETKSDGDNALDLKQNSRVNDIKEPVLKPKALIDQTISSVYENNTKELVISQNVKKETSSRVSELEEKVLSVPVEWGSFPSNLSPCPAEKLQNDNIDPNITNNEDFAELSGDFESNMFDSSESDLKAGQAKALLVSEPNLDKENTSKENVSLGHNMNEQSEHCSEKKNDVDLINEIRKDMEVSCEDFSDVFGNSIFDSEPTDSKNHATEVSLKTISEHTPASKAIPQIVDNIGCKDVLITKALLENESLPNVVNDKKVVNLRNKSMVDSENLDHEANVICVDSDSSMESPGKKSTSSLEENLWSSRENDRYSYCDDNISTKHFDEDIFASISSNSNFDIDESELKCKNSDVTVIPAPKKLDADQMNINRCPSPEYEHLDDDMRRFLKDSDDFSDIGEMDIAINFQRIAEKQKQMRSAESPSISIHKSSTSESSIKPVGAVKKLFPNTASSSSSDNQSKKLGITNKNIKRSQKASEHRTKTFRRIRTLSDSSSEPENLSPMLDKVVPTAGNVVKEFIDLSSQNEKELRPSQAMARVLENIQADLHCMDDRSQENVANVEEIVFGSSPLGPTQERAPMNCTDFDLPSALSTETGDMTIEAQNKLVAEIENLKMQLEEWKQKQRSTKNLEDMDDEEMEEESEDAIPPTPERPRQSFINISKAPVFPFQ